MDELEIVANLVRIAEEEGVFGIEVTVQGRGAARLPPLSIQLGSSAAPVDLEEAEDEALADEAVPTTQPPRRASSPPHGHVPPEQRAQGAALVEVGQMVQEGSRSVASSPQVFGDYLTADGSRDHGAG